MSDEALRAALLERGGMWKEALERAQRLMNGRATDVADAARLVDDYRLLAHDLARARELLPDSRAREFLETAYAQAHAAIHKPVTHPGYRSGACFEIRFQKRFAGSGRTSSGCRCCSSRRSSWGTGS